MGLASAFERARAEQDLNVIRAEASDDPVKIAQAKLDRASAILKLVEPMYRAGLSGADDLESARADVKQCEAELTASKALPTLK